MIVSVKKLFFTVVLIFLSVSVFASPGRLGQTLLQIVKSATGKTDGQWTRDMESLEKSLFGKSPGPFSMEEIVKLREEGVEPSKWLKGYKDHLKHRRNNPQYYQNSPEPDILNYIWDTEGIEAHMMSYVDSPLISRWLDVPEIQERILDILGGYPLNKNYFTGKPDVLLKYWELGESQKVELMIKESFDKARRSDDFNRAFFIEDPFVGTVSRAFNESESFKSHVESLFESLFDE